MQQGKVKIGILDDHPLVVKGIENFISQKSELEVCFTSCETANMLQLIEEHQISLLIIDIVMPGVSGLNLLEKIKNTYPELRIIAYSSLSSAILIKNLLAIGINGFVNKMQNENDLLEAIKQVLSGQIYLPVDYHYVLAEKEEDFQKLTEREKEVLELIIRGKISKEIALELNIAKNTVDIHRASLFKKFAVQNLAELIQKATKMGY